MANFDTTSKKQIETDPKDFVHLCFGFEAADITVLEIITPEQPTVEMHQADSLIKTIYNDDLCQLTNCFCYFHKYRIL